MWLISSSYSTFDCRLMSFTRVSMVSKVNQPLRFHDTSTLARKISSHL